jgi:hypothetical protein
MTATHSLGGVITGPSVAGATVVLSGAAAATSTADTLGNYSFSGVADGTYKVTPSKTGLSLRPVNQTVTISGAHNLGVNFTASQLLTSSRVPSAEDWDSPCL